MTSLKPPGAPSEPASSSEAGFNIAAIALGSNLHSAFGTPAQNLHEALLRLGALGSVISTSSFHATVPVGYVNQPDFLNAAVVLETVLPPLPLLQALLAIESAMGRDRSLAPPKGPRIIDLDLLLYDDLILATPELTLPHPAMHLRGFVLAPLAEIASGWPHPVLGDDIGTLLAQLRP